MPQTLQQLITSSQNPPQYEPPWKRALPATTQGGSATAVSGSAVSYVIARGGVPAPAPLVPRDAGSPLAYALAVLWQTWGNA